MPILRRFPCAPLTDGQTSSVVFDFPQDEYFPGSPPWPVAVMGDQLYFATNQRLYVSDGTEAHEAFTFEYPVGSPEQIFGTSNQPIFWSSAMLFSFDGSDAGAQLIAGSSSQSFDFVPLGAVGDQFYFRHREWTLRHADRCAVGHGWNRRRHEVHCPGGVR